MGPGVRAGHRPPGPGRLTRVLTQRRPGATALTCISVPGVDTTVTVLVAETSGDECDHVGQRLIGGDEQDYRTPFADEAMDWIMANLVGIIICGFRLG